MKKHAILSASSSHRWMECPGSIVSTIDFPDESNVYAEEGTLAHSLAEKMLLGLPYNKEDYPEEMISYCEAYKDYVFSFPFSDMRVEVLCDYNEVTGHAVIKDEKDSFGTSDCVQIDEGLVRVFDFKYGKGKQIHADENPQLLLYSIPFAGSDDRLELHIYQPRLDHVSRFETTMDSPFIKQFRERVRVSADAVVKGLNGEDVSYKAGEHCKFCKLAGCCKVQSEFLMKEVLDDFDSIDDLNDDIKPKSVECSDDEIERILTFIPMIETWCKTVFKEALKREINGANFSRFRLSKGRDGNRKWSDEDIVKLIAGPESIKEVVRSPSELEKFLPRKGNENLWNELDKQITRSEGKPTLVSVKKNLLDGF